MHECFSKQFIVMFHEQGPFYFVLYNNHCASTKVQKTNDCQKHNYTQLKAEPSKQSHSNCSHFYTKTS